MEKIITPSYQVSGKRKKLVGYIGELRDGETIISSLEYPSQHAVEVALDRLAFDILSDQADQGLIDTVPAFGPSTCVFCNRPHHPQHCPEKNAILFRRDADLIWPPLDVDFAPASWEV